MKIEQKVLHTIEKYDLIKKNDSILIALSGGVDSVTLLVILLKLQKKLKLELSAVYINHQIRKKAAKIEEKFCQQLCDKSNTELHLITENIQNLAKKNKKGLEETARDFRYGVFEMLAKEFQFDKIALGHHANDRVETTLFRIFRGTGKSGMIGIKPKRGLYIRPLFELSKEEILSFALKNKIPYHTDSTNKKIEFSRNYIRNRLLPNVRKNLNPAVDKVILNLADISAEEDAFLQKITERELKKTLRTTSGRKLIIDIVRLSSRETWLRRRILRHCLTTLSGDNLPPDKTTVEQLDQMILSNQKAVSLHKKIEAKTVNRELILYPRKKIRFTRKLIVNDSCPLEKLDYIVVTKVKERTNITVRRQKQSFAGQFDFEKIETPITIRSVNAGDRFSPLGLSGSKKVSDYLTDKKINPVFRDEIPVVADKNGIFWLVGQEIDNRVKITSQTKKVLEIEFHQ